MSADLSEIVKAYDVRGLVPGQLDATVCTALGSAFAQVVARPEGAPSVVVGYDMRESSPGLAAAFAAGVRGQGIAVTSIGLASTDQVYYASGALGLPAAMVTASHNPAGYNGLKLCRAGARPVGTDTGLPQIRDLAQWLLDRGDVHDLPRPAEPAPLTERDVQHAYARFLHSLVDLRGGRELTVVVDAGNGMAGHTVPVVLGDPDVPVTVVPLYLELDGTFPHHPADPLDPANLRDLQAAVVAHGADLGLAFDGDADRCFVVDERGGPVSPSAVTALVAEREIAREVARGVDPADVVVVHNLVCSRVVPEAIAGAGARPVRTRVGHSYVKAVMAEQRAVFGGEHSGHYYFRDFWFADTGMLAALHVLAALAGQDGPLSRVVAPYLRTATSGEVNRTVPDVPAALALVRTFGREQGCSEDALDGLTLVSPDGWWLSLRASNTEPLLRLNVEADDRATMEAVRDRVLDLVGGGTAPEDAARPLR